jgi:hypothetical protein
MQFPQGHPCQLPFLVSLLKLLLQPLGNTGHQRITGPFR